MNAKQRRKEKRRTTMVVTNVDWENKVVTVRHLYSIGPSRNPGEITYKNVYPLEARAILEMMHE